MRRASGDYPRLPNNRPQKFNMSQKLFTKVSDREFYEFRRVIGFWAAPKNRTVAAPVAAATVGPSAPLLPTGNGLLTGTNDFLGFYDWQTRRGLVKCKKLRTKKIQRYCRWHRERKLLVKSVSIFFDWSLLPSPVHPRSAASRKLQRSDI